MLEGFIFVFLDALLHWTACLGLHVCMVLSDMTPQLWINEFFHVLGLPSLRRRNPNIRTVERVYIGKEGKVGLGWGWWYWLGCLVALYLHVVMQWCVDASVINSRHRTGAGGV